MLSDNTNQFFSTLEDAFKKAAEDAGYEVISLSSGNDAAKDVTNMEDLLTQNPDVIVYNPVDSDAAGDAVAMANDAGIPVVTVDRAANSGDIVCHIASDNVYGGEIAAQYIVDQLPDGGQVVEIRGGGPRLPLLYRLPGDPYGVGQLLLGDAPPFAELVEPFTKFHGDEPPFFLGSS